MSHEPMDDFDDDEEGWIDLEDLPLPKTGENYEH